MQYRFLRFPEGLAKAVTLSYDDGCIQDKRFSQRISKVGLKCTFNICSNKSKLTDDEIREYIISKGHEVAIHGKNHRAPGIVRAIDGIRDVLECRMELEERFDTIIRGMAYPDTGIRRCEGGLSYARVKEYLCDLDIAYARTACGDNNRFFLPDDWHKWMPNAHHENPKLMELIDEFLETDLSEKAYAASRDARLFYLWGHSHEFDRADNWDLLDKICDKLGGKEDVWYATNIEVCEYVKAYYSLIYSADGRKIFNPTSMDVWADVDGKCYKIASGKTIRI